MSTIVQRDSARIYQFPVGGRDAARGYRPEAEPALEHQLPRNAKVVVGGSWYHEAAIQDAERQRVR